MACVRLAAQLGVELEVLETQELDAELTSYTSARNAEPATAPMGDAGAVPVA